MKFEAEVEERPREQTWISLKTKPSKLGVRGERCALKGVGTFQRRYKKKV